MILSVTASFAGQHQSVCASSSCLRTVHAPCLEWFVCNDKMDGHPLAGNIPTEVLQAMELEIVAAIERGVPEDDPDLIALQKALTDITGSKFVPGAFRAQRKKPKRSPLEPPERDGYEGATDTEDSDDDDAPAFNPGGVAAGDEEQDDVALDRSATTKQKLVTFADEAESNKSADDVPTLPEPSKESGDVDGNIQSAAVGLYDGPEYAGIFDNALVKIAVDCAPDVLARELCMIPLVHRIEVVEIIIDTFPQEAAASGLSVRCADEPREFTKSIVNMFAKLYAPLVVRPLGTLEPLLSENPADATQVRIRVQLFWRCAIQMHCQVVFFPFFFFSVYAMFFLQCEPTAPAPLPDQELVCMFFFIPLILQALSSLITTVKRRKEFEALLPELEACTRDYQRRFLTVRMWLPVFSMIAEAPRESEPIPAKSAGSADVEEIGSAEAVAAAQRGSQFIAANAYEGSKPG